MARTDLEIPLGKRTKKYRFFEILPGALSYILVILLFLLSIFSPVLGAIYLLVIIALTLVKAIATAFRTVQGYNVMQSAKRVDWRQRFEDLKQPHEAYEKLHGQNYGSYGFREHIDNVKKLSVAQRGDYPDPDKIYHAVIMAAYNEGMETMIPSIEAVKASTFDKKKIIFVLAYEERGGEAMKNNAKALKEMFRNDFYDFLTIEHPKDLKNEVVGKGPNLTYAGEKLSEYVAKKHIKSENVIVTSLDSDNRMSDRYLDYVAYEFVVHEDRQHLSYQPISIFTNNLWDVPAPMRVIAISNSFFNVISTMRPYTLRNFASHSQPLWALEQMGYWSKRTIVEDGHQYWRSLFYFKGDYSVLPIRVPIYQDAVLSETFRETLKAQFIQLRRWDYGASDVAYVGSRMFGKDKPMSALQLFPKFVRLLDGHVTLAIMSPIVAFGGWVPMIMNLTSRHMVAYNLPNVVSTVQMIACVGLIITVIVSMKVLPKRPAKYRRGKSVTMLLQWVLMPIIALVYTSLAAFYSQTRLILGKYMEKFDVTKKVVKQ